MKILDVKNTVPYPLSTGTHIASYQFLKTLALTHEVSFFGLAHSDREMENAGGLKKFCRNIVITSAPNRKSILHKIFYRLFYTMNLLFRGKPFEESYSSPGPGRRLSASTSVTSTTIWSSRNTGTMPGCSNTFPRGLRGLSSSMTRPS